MLWYSPGMFGNRWKKLAGLKKKPHETKSSYTGAIIASAIMALVFSLFYEAAGLTTVSDGVSLAFFMWLGFVATTQINIVLWEKKPWNLYFINVFQILVGMIAMGAILSV